MPKLSVGVGDFFGIAILDNFAVFDEDGAVAIFTDIFHGMGDQNDGLFVVFEV